MSRGRIPVHCIVSSSLRKTTVFITCWYCFRLLSVGSYPTIYGIKVERVTRPLLESKSYVSGILIHFFSDTFCDEYIDRVNGVISLKNNSYFSLLLDLQLIDHDSNSVSSCFSGNLSLASR